MASQKKRNTMQDMLDEIFYIPVAEIEREKREIEQQEKTSTDEA